MAKKRRVATKAESANGQTPAVPEDAIVRANINRQIIPGEAYSALYANDTQIQMSPWDFRFMFGVIASLPTSANPTILVSW